MNKVTAILKIKEAGIGRYSYHNIYDFPCTIGRSFDNDIILTHTSISHHHAIIEQSDSTCVIRDVDSTNGISFNGKQVKTASFGSSKKRITIGAFHVELLREDSLEKTIIKKVSHFANKHLSIQHFALYIFLYYIGTFLASLLEKWLVRPIDSKALLQVGKTTLFLFIALALVTSVIGLMGKIQIKRYVFKPVFLFLLYLTLLFPILSLPVPYFSFALNNKTVADIFSMLLAFPYVLYTLYGVGRKLFPLSTPRKIALIAFSIYLGFFTLGKISKYSMDDDYNYNFSAPYTYSLFSYSQEKHSIKTLMNQMDKSFTEADEHRTEINNKKAELK